MVTKEFKGLVRGEYGATPVPIKPEFIKKIIGDEEPITCRPADRLEPELDKMRDEMKEWYEQEEDVLTYAQFGQVAVKFFEKRRNDKYHIDGDHLHMEEQVHPSDRKNRSLLKAPFRGFRSSIPSPMGRGGRPLIRSMTGFGRCQKTVAGMDITVELKSVNHRYYEYSSRLQRAYGFLDDKLKSYLQKYVSRASWKFSSTSSLWKRRAATFRSICPWPGAISGRCWNFGTAWAWPTALSGSWISPACPTCSASTGLPRMRRPSGQRCGRSWTKRPAASAP